MCRCAAAAWRFAWPACNANRWKAYEAGRHNSSRVIGNRMNPAWHQPVRESITPDNPLRTPMNAVTTQLKVITSPVEFYALRSEWDDLWSRANGRHHEAFTVCWLSWLRVSEPQARKLRIILLRENGRLVAAWPLVSYRKFFWTVLRPLSPESADYTSILVEDGPSTSAFIEQIWRAAHQRFGADIILLPYVGVNSDLYRLASKHRRVMVAKQHLSAVAKLRSENDWGAYCTSLGTLFEKNLAYSGGVLRNRERWKYVCSVPTTQTRTQGRSTGCWLASASGRIA